MLQERKLFFFLVCKCNHCTLSFLSLFFLITLGSVSVFAKFTRTNFVVPYARRARLRRVYHMRGEQDQEEEKR